MDAIGPSRRSLASEESYRQLVAKSPDAILVHRQGTIIFANRALALLFGTFSTDELVVKKFLDFVDPRDRGTIEQKIQKYHNDPVHVRQAETSLLRPDGTKICTESIAHSVMYQGGAAVQVMFRDISKRQRAEQELRRSEANLADAQKIAHLVLSRHSLLSAPPMRPLIGS
jgi:PAS domain S-box-containing protein